MGAIIGKRRAGVLSLRRPRPTIGAPMKILLSNDDGYQAPGIVALYEAIRDLGEVEVVAPEHNNSAKSNALTLHAPAILCDPLLRHHGSIDVEMLHELSGLPADDVTRVYQAASTARVTGWNEIWGTPKLHECAIEPGSVFLFAWKGDVDDELYQALFRLEESGIGLRRAEGFGRVCVSDPFHLEGMLR